MRDAVAQGDSTVADDRNDFVEIMLLFFFLIVWNNLKDVLKIYVAILE